MADSHAMEARGLKVAFGGLPILKGVDLCVESGDLYGLLGRNGAGKTTARRKNAPPGCRITGAALTKKELS